MKKEKREVYLIRHAEKGFGGTLTDKGRQDAENLGENLPTFQNITSSESPRTQETANLATGIKPTIDYRAGFYMASLEKSRELNRIAEAEGIPFLEAIFVLDDPEVLQGVIDKATVLNDLINQLLADLPEGAKAILVSHDLSISPAMEQRGVPLESINYLSGYIIDEDGEVCTFNP